MVRLAGILELAEEAWAATCDQGARVPTSGRPRLDRTRGVTPRMTLKLHRHDLRIPFQERQKTSRPPGVTPRRPRRDTNVRLDRLATALDCHEAPKTRLLGLGRRGRSRAARIAFDPAGDGQLHRMTVPLHDSLSYAPRFDARQAKKFHSPPESFSLSNALQSRLCRNSIVCRPATRAVGAFPPTACAPCVGAASTPMPARARGPETRDVR